MIFGGAVLKGLEQLAFELAAPIEEVVMEAVEEYLASNLEQNEINRSEIQEMPGKEPVIR